MQQHTFFQSRWRIAIALLAITLVLSLSLVYTLKFSTATRAAGAHTHAKPFTITYKGHQFPLIQGSKQPPTDAQCRSQFGSPCYSPQEMQNAYGLTDILSKGFNGTGQSIVIIDSFGSPSIKADLHTFDVGYGLPDPPSFKEYAPLGKKPFDPQNGTMVGWAVETTLDVEWAHSMAPGANIVLMTSPVAETQGVQGMLEFLFLEQHAAAHRLGKIISQSWATTENTLLGAGGRQVLLSFNNFYEQIGRSGFTVFTSSGDSGVANPNVHGKIYPFPTVNFPASSPYVTAVGGTSLMADTQGNYQSEHGWQGSGGGVSQAFREPAYQKANLNSSNQKILNGFRGVPDISYNADPNTPILIYLSFLGQQNAGYYGIGGTSEGSPQWAGILADGDQLAGHPLGFINDALYAIGNSKQASKTYHDVTVGNNSSGGLPGYNCSPGWDPVTGWGSPQASTLLMAIINMQSALARK